MNEEWKNILKVDNVNKFFGGKEKLPQFTIDGLKFSNQNDLDKYNKYKNDLGTYSNTFTQTLKNEGGVFLGINSINSAYQKIMQIKRTGSQQAEATRQGMNQRTTSNKNTGGTHTPSGTRWQG
tara:strand:+ start:412 stop:780 length:369 start_codon:yes stop_codon:yes gene_type:complete